MWEPIYSQITCPSAALALPDGPPLNQQCSRYGLQYIGANPGQTSIAFVPQESELEMGAGVGDVSRTMERR